MITSLVFEFDDLKLDGMVHYIRAILNTVYAKMLAEGVSQAIIDEFARISPIAWSNKKNCSHHE